MSTITVDDKLYYYEENIIFKFISRFTKWLW